MKVTKYENDVLSIEFSEGEEVKGSEFPDKLVTVDFDRAGQVMGVMFVGSALEQIRKALCVTEEEGS
jgi:uncharacterized protein YuzE